MEKTGHLDPKKWDWGILNSQLMPVKTEMPPALMDLLHVLRCNCKIGCFIEMHLQEACALLHVVNAKDLVVVLSPKPLDDNDLDNGCECKFI